MDFMKLIDDTDYNPEDSIREIVKMGYTREEAINILGINIKE